MATFHNRPDDRYWMQLTVIFLLLLSSPLLAQSPLELTDVFRLQYAQGPQISPDGTTIIYTLTSADIQTDKFTTRLWSIDSDGPNHFPLTRDESGSYSSPRWSADGSQLAVASTDGDTHQLLVRSGQRKKFKLLVDLPAAATALSWSADGSQLAFSSFVATEPVPFVELPAVPAGASWAAPARVIDKMIYRRDGSGYVKHGNNQLFVVSVLDGSLRQLTHSDYDHNGPFAWMADGSAIILSGQLFHGWEHAPRNSNIYSVSSDDGTVRQLTDGDGPETDPIISADGNLIAYIGFVDDKRSFQQSDLYVVSSQGGQVRCLTTDFDRSIRAPRWSADGSLIYFLYDDHGVGTLGSVSLEDFSIQELATNIGGTSIGRPYQAGSYSVSEDGRIAFTMTDPNFPAEVAVQQGQQKPKRLTMLNNQLFEERPLATTERFVYQSSLDQQPIDGWIVKPANFDADKKYPLILEIHGGPFANYGSRFAMEMQLYAAAGYVVLYTNPRGSTSYGNAFTDLIDHNYPCEGDFQDLMSGVDAVIERGYIDSQRLFVTGGSGGGVLTAWVVGKTERFKAAVAQKPVINWYSFALTSDAYNYFSDYWFAGPPWQTDQTKNYLERSPLSLVGNVTTPTMLLTGEQDYRTPMSESEQYYQALKLRGIDSVLVRIPNASHAIVARPSRIMVKVAHILKWFETYDGR